MSVYASITDVGEKIKNDFRSSGDKKGLSLLYAFNATGKTRLSVELDQLNENEDGQIKVLSYNALLEDLFTWNNEDFELNFDPNSWVSRLAAEQGIENNIANNFKSLLHSNIEPVFDFSKGRVTFNISSGDDSSVNCIKISRGEESVFVWSIFYSFLETAIDALNTDEESRATTAFNHLEYVVIDDPVSSIDDSRIIAIAVGLFEIIRTSKNPSLSFFITTHHALFYNVLYNSFGRLKKTEIKSLFYILSKNRDNTLELREQGSDTPFAYHLLVKDQIWDVIESGDIEKYHYNLFRGLLEKTASFLGYRNWSDCVTGTSKEEFIRTVNLYSHSKLSELESGLMSDSDKQIFVETFRKFVEDFHFQNSNHVG